MARFSRIQVHGSHRGALVAVAGAAVISLALAGCAGGGDTASTTEPTSEADGLFSQELHDLLPEAIQEAGVISFGGLWETPPVLSVDLADPTKPAGIAPDVAALFGEVLGVDVEWQNLAWPAQLPGLQAGSVDVLFGQVSINAEREQSVVDLTPFQVKTHALLVPEGNPKDLTAIADMCGLTIAVPIGSNQSARVAEISEADCVGAGEPAIVLAEYQGAAAATQALRAGTVDAWLDVENSVNATVTADPDVFAAVPVPTDEMPTEYSGIAVSKDNPGLSEALAGALRILVENGMYEEIYESYDVSSNLELEMIEINPVTGTPVGEMAAS